MTSLAIIKSKYSVFRDKNKDVGSWQLFVKLVRASLRLVTAKYYLRNCTSVGKWVTTNGKPVVDNEGVMIIGDDVKVWSTIIQSKLYTGAKGKLVVGRNCHLNGVHVDARTLINIGENVRIAPYTIILDSDFHDVNDHFADGVTRPIEIEDDVWIATRATILKGVRIGKGSVIAAGAVVTRDIPPYCLAGGVPARVIKELK